MTGRKDIDYINHKLSKTFAKALNACVWPLQMTERSFYNISLGFELFEKVHCLRVHLTINGYSSLYKSTKSLIYLLFFSRHSRTTRILLHI